MKSPCLTVRFLQNRIYNRIADEFIGAKIINRALGIAWYRNSEANDPTTG